jgi:hypothetical protein
LLAALPFRLREFLAVLSVPCVALGIKALLDPLPSPATKHLSQDAPIEVEKVCPLLVAWLGGLTHKVP